jgi:predicted aldo/keto reductase-like oxidoreductase
MAKLGVLAFLDRAKSEGKITNAGFSFHGTIAAFKEIVDAYDWQFCQIQYNFLDENNQAGTEGLRYAAGKNLAVMVMEPLRGGNLAGPVPDEVQKIWDEEPEKRSAAEWGFRWVWDHPEVTVVLSGMNNEDHIEENIRVAGSSHPQSLTSDDLARIDRVNETYRRLMKVGCTGCGYCMPCPAGVDIPGCFSLYNACHLFPKDRSTKFHYFGRHGGLIGDVSYAGLCRQCGKCARACPQHLPIPQLMKDVKADMEGGMRAVVPVLKGGLWCMNKMAKVRALFSR